MKNEQYSALARVYDALNSEVDYPAWADFLSRAIRKYERTETSLVLDLACGTGKITFELEKLGYDMTGIDLSEEMLAVAREQAYRTGKNDILWLCQDMTEFELYGTVDATVCCLDSLNYLLKTADLARCFALVHNYLIPDGIFLFDVNSPRKFETVYGENAYVLEADGIYCGWQNRYHPKTKICDFCLDIFEEQADGSYERTSELQRERAYSDKTIRKLLADAGFEMLEWVSDFAFTPATDSDDRWFYAARAKK